MRLRAGGLSHPSGKTDTSLPPLHSRRPNFPRKGTKVEDYARDIKSRIKSCNIRKSFDRNTIGRAEVWLEASSTRRSRTNKWSEELVDLRVLAGIFHNSGMKYETGRDHDECDLS